MQPLASTRISLSWPPEPAAEPEDVLVISGRSGFFLDLRTVKASAASSEVRERETTAGVDPRISWATAGWKELLPLSHGEEHPRARFTAVLDSRRPLCHTSPHAPRSIAEEGDCAAAAPDEGSFETLPNGDVREEGFMLRPETGHVSAYEEIWRRLLPPQGALRSVFLEWNNADGREKAFLGQVGDYELGISDGEAGMAVVRRERRDSGSWATVFTAGGCARLPSLADVAVGQGQQEIELGGSTWRVIESS